MRGSLLLLFAAAALAAFSASRASEPVCYEYSVPEKTPGSGSRRLMMPALRLLRMSMIRRLSVVLPM